MRTRHAPTLYEPPICSPLGVRSTRVGVSEPARPAADPRAALLVFAVVALVWAIAVVPATEFVFDDFVFIVDAQVDPVGVWTTDSYSAVGYTGSPATVYRPLGVLAHAAERALFGTDSARPWHLVSVLLHGLAAVLLFGWLRGLGVRVGAAAAAGLLWGLSPLHAESVGWAVAHFELLSSTLVLGALLLAVRGAWPAAAACFLLALPIKETSLVALPALLASCFIAERARDPDQRPRATLWLAGLTGVGAASFLNLRAAAGVEQSLPADGSLISLALSVGGAVLRGLGLGDVLRTAGPATDPPTLAGSIGLVLLAAALVLAARRAPRYAIGTAALGLVCVPGLLYGQRAHSVVSDPDRYFYLASCAVPALLALAWPKDDRERRWATPGAVLLGGWLAFAAIGEGRTFKTFEANLLRHVELGRDNDYVAYLLGQERLKAGDPCGAAEHLARAAELANSPGRRAAAREAAAASADLCSGGAVVPSPGR